MSEYVSQLPIIEFWSLIVLISISIATIYYGWQTRKQVNTLTTQLKMTQVSMSQTSRANLDLIRNQHNWELFKNRVDPGLPGLPEMNDNNL
ncbi:MAG: hypothetical protein OES23_04935 [Nitrosopumilus sp.]|nr:hypothetical protein [Nitrosopumilus sp.]